MPSFRRNPARIPARPGDFPALELPGGGRTRVAGLSFHAAALSRVTAGADRSGSAWNLSAVLVREPRNEYDANAIGVWVDDEQIGHVNREDAVGLAPLIDRVEAAGLRASCTCHVWGGHDGIFGAELWLIAAPGLAAWLDGALPDAPS
jgi:hypothetical protein